MHGDDNDGSSINLAPTQQELTGTQTKSLHCACRMALVQVLFESHPGPAIPESNPELRAVLLDSLKTYEHEEAQRPAFGGQPHIPVPEASSAGTGCQAYKMWHFQVLQHLLLSCNASNIVAHLSSIWNVGFHALADLIGISCIPG